MAKICLNLSGGIRFLRHPSKKLTKSLISVGLISVVSISQSLSYAQELWPNETRPISLDIGDDHSEIMKVLREELDGWEGYTWSFLSMLSDNEIKDLYFSALSQSKLGVK